MNKVLSSNTPPICKFNFKSILAESIRSLLCQNHCDSKWTYIYYYGSSVKKITVRRDGRKKWKLRKTTKTVLAVAVRCAVQFRRSHIWIEKSRKRGRKGAFRRGGICIRESRRFCKQSDSRHIYSRGEWSRGRQSSRWRRDGRGTIN